MKFSTKIRYGVRTMLEIALHEEKEGILQKEIAKNQRISFKYLDQIISTLKASDLISTVKGKKSGYKLTRKPSEITILDIHNAFEPGLHIVDCLSKHIDCPSEKDCASKVLWEGLNSHIEGYLSGYTLEDLKNDQIRLNLKEQEK
ncbi:MAG: RrF2 family transcriptional regulator [Bacteroidota bacterium]